MTPDCPSREELARIGVGTNLDSCPDDMAQHIDGCPECREFLEYWAQAGLDSAVYRTADLPPREQLPRINGFMIERELGRGAMGVVYQARQFTPNRLVAVKLLPGGRRAGPRERRRWLREAEAASTVHHPGVVTLFEVRETDTYFLIVLEYIAGGTLASRLSAPLEPRHCARLLESIARAVHHIHECGQLHLDLKPSNILLDGDAESAWDCATPKVSDFGIARPVEASDTDTAAAGPGGTPSYMAPEQITRPRSEMTAAADIHGLGATLYHMLTGRPPHQGSTVLETIDLVQRHEAIPPRRLNPRIPIDLETICLKCLEKDPSQRYGSAALLADDLSRWQAGRTILARPTSPVEKGWRWCRRRPLIATLAFTLALTLMGSLVLITTLWRRAEDQVQMSNVVVSDLLDATIGGMSNLPKTSTLDHVTGDLEKDRQHLLALSKSQPRNAKLRLQLAIVDGRLGVSLAQGRRHEEAKRILLESQATLDALARQFPGDKRIRDLQARHLRLLAEECESTQDPEETARYLREAVELAELRIREGMDLPAVGQLVDSQRSLAWFRYRQGRREEATAWLAASRRVLNNLPPGLKWEGLPAERLKIDIDLLICAEVPSKAKEAPTPDGADGDPGLTSPADAAQSPDEWAGKAMASLRHGDTAHVPGNVLNLAYHFAELAATFRRLDDADRAGSISHRLLALANRLVAEYPDGSYSYVVQSLAYVQLYKNAWQVDDLVAVKANMSLALAAAERALVLDNTSEHADQLAHSLRRRLAALNAKE